MVLVVATFVGAAACLWYAHIGLRTGDPVLVVAGVLAAAGFALAAVLYWWLVW